MLVFEILVLMALGRIVAWKARAKGYNGCAFILLFLPLGILGELSGATAAATVAEMIDLEDLKLAASLFGGMIGGGIGAALMFAFIKLLPPASEFAASAEAPPEPEEDSEAESW
jgi:hypothetical protein